MTLVQNKSDHHRWSILTIEILLVALVPLLLATTSLNLWHWDFTIPLVYAGSDDVWQLVLTKVLTQTGWVLNNPYLGAPDIAHWHFNAAAQTSAIHSIIMRLLGLLWSDAVQVQQVYYLLNFSLISLTTYFTARTLGIKRVIAAAIALLFTFTSFRIGWLFYAFLANYFAVPLAMIPIFWILTGEYEKATASQSTLSKKISGLLRFPKFWVGLLCILIVTISDGYYAFFTLLLLGFSGAARVLYGDLRKPASLAAPLIFILALFSLALAMALPLKIYQENNVDEFYPSGKPDASIFKQPFEAEVYASSLKLLIAPIPNHRIDFLGTTGQRMIATSDASKRLPLGKPIVALGTIPSLLLAGCFILVVLLLTRQIRPTNGPKPLPTFLCNNPVLWSAILLSLFIFLSATSGGLGTLIALVYPTIRAYDRFPLFLILTLLLGAGALLSACFGFFNRTRIIHVSFLVLACTIFGVYDQMPRDSVKTNEQTKEKFLAERNFIHALEKDLPSGAMVYQYPHSQYLSDNKYYGWGSFAHIRLFLHSKDIRWSNGASKNSFVEMWHERIKDFPIPQLIANLNAVGFKGMVIDRTVLSNEDYKKTIDEINKVGLSVSPISQGGLSYVRFGSPKLRVNYDSKFLQVETLTLSSPWISNDELPIGVDAFELDKFLKQAPRTYPLIIKRAQQSQIFPNWKSVSKGYGESPIQPLSDMKGTLICLLEPMNSTQQAPTVLRLKLTNESDFDWYLGQGNMPLGIGAHVYEKGTLRTWDDGYRMAFKMPVPRNTAGETKIELSQLIGKVNSKQHPVRFRFALVQDGHAWFEGIHCDVDYDPEKLRFTTQ